MSPTVRPNRIIRTSTKRRLVYRVPKTMKGRSTGTAFRFDCSNVTYVKAFDCGPGSGPITRRQRLNHELGVPRVPGWNRLPAISHSDWRFTGGHRRLQGDGL